MQNNYHMSKKSWPDPEKSQKVCLDPRVHPTCGQDNYVKPSYAFTFGSMVHCLIERVRSGVTTAPAAPAMRGALTRWGPKISELIIIQRIVDFCLKL